MSGIKAKTLQVLDEGGSFIHHTKADQKIEPSFTQLGQRPKDMSHPSDSLGGTEGKSRSISRRASEGEEPERKLSCTPRIFEEYTI